MSHNININVNVLSFKMKNKIAKTVLSVSAFFFISAAYAADGTLHATGDVTTSTCAIAPVQGDESVDLSSIKMSALKNGIFDVNSNYRKTFHIDFTDCPAGQSYTVLFERNKAGGSNYSAGNEVSGGSNVDLAIANEPYDNKFFLLTGVKSGVQVTTTTDSSLTYAAYPGKSTGTITPGEVVYNIEYTIDFL